jgi:RimJ/RimL family protein N-acetyltransferase
MGAVAAPFALKPTLVGELVVLRSMSAGDADAVYDVVTDPDARRLTGTHRTFSRDEIAAWTASRGDLDDRLDLVIVDRATDVVVGEVVINDWDGDNLSCGFRIGIGPAGRDRGLGSEATRLVIDHVFSSTDAQRIELEVYAFNERAAHVYEKVGFRREGVRRSALRWDGAFYDAVVMSVLRPEWSIRTGAG